MKLFRNNCYLCNKLIWSKYLERLSMTLTLTFFNMSLRVSLGIEHAMYLQLPNYRFGISVLSQTSLQHKRLHIGFSHFLICQVHDVSLWGVYKLCSFFLLYSGVFSNLPECSVPRNNQRPIFFFCNFELSTNIISFPPALPKIMLTLPILCSCYKAIVPNSCPQLVSSCLLFSCIFQLSVIWWVLQVSFNEMLL